MDRTQLLAEIAAADAPADGVLYLERLAEDYRCRWPLDQPYPTRH